jgi:menaquinone-dependent protoporphyrinogen IX oxidase
MAGGPTDTSRDYEFTDWVALDRFVLDRVSPAQAS